jgi:hypothetical protein
MSGSLTWPNRSLQDADSDALDEDDAPSKPPAKRPRKSAAISAGQSSGTATPADVPLKGIGEFMMCAQCDKQFTVVGVASLANI